MNTNLGRQIRSLALADSLRLRIWERTDPMMIKLPPLSAKLAKFPPSCNGFHILGEQLAAPLRSCLYMLLPSIYLSICLSVCLPACLSVCLPVCLPVCLSVIVYLSICLSTIWIYLHVSAPSVRINQTGSFMETCTVCTCTIKPGFWKIQNWKHIHLLGANVSKQRCRNPKQHETMQNSSLVDTQRLGMLLPGMPTTPIHTQNLNLQFYMELPWATRESHESKKSREENHLSNHLEHIRRRQSNGRANRCAADPRLGNDAETRAARTAWLHSCASRPGACTDDVQRPNFAKFPKMKYLRPKGRGWKLVGQGGMRIERICGATFWVSFFWLTR